MDEPGLTLEQRAALLAERQHGVVARGQLQDLGCGRGWIDGRRQRGLLAQLHVGVYAVGHRALRREGRWLAAVLAVGDDAVLSHASVGAALGWCRDPAVVHVTVTGAKRSRPGIVVHRVAALADPDRTRLHGVPATAPWRTLVDLCDVLDVSAVRAVCDGLRHVDEAALRATLARAPTRRAHTWLAHLLDGGPRTRSELERAFVRFAARFGLPRPQCNVRVEGLLVDCFWPDLRLVVELDSQSWHAHMGARRNDFDRDAKLLAAGYRPLRMAWADLVHEPDRGFRRVQPFFAEA